MESLRERDKVIGSDCTLDTFKVIQYDKTFRWVYCIKEG